VEEHVTQPRLHDSTTTRLLGLPGFRVLAAGVVGGELEVLIETGEAVTGCPCCGVLATAHARRPTLVRDVPWAGRPVLLVWSKRVWRCAEPACATRTWSEKSQEIRPRATLTERARRWACRRVGKHGDTVAGLARELGVGWGTVWRAVAEHGRPLVDDPHRLDDVSALGVDEHVWQHAGPRRRTQYATGIVDLTPGRPARLLDVVPGRTGKVYEDWISAREQDWRDGITVAALDPFRGYANALHTALPEATRVLDAFHVVKLGNQVLDEVRRRVQQDQLGHRGHKHDPLFEVRRLLRRGADTLTDEQRARIEAALQAGDPDWEVTIAWHSAQRLRAVYHAPTPAEGRALAEQLLESLPTCPIGEVARLGRTLRSWRSELLAYFDTDGASNGPTEAMNLLIEKARRVGHGFRNFGNYRLRLLLLCGVEWHTPLTPRIRGRHPRLVA
jgi:transposase